MASTPCTPPPSPPSQVSSCVPAKSLFSMRGDGPYSEVGTWRTNTNEFKQDHKQMIVIATVCVWCRSSHVLPGQLYHILKQELLHWECQTRNVDHWTLVCWKCRKFLINTNVFDFCRRRFSWSFERLHTKIFRELLCVERGTHEDDFEVISDIQ